MFPVSHLHDYLSGPWRVDRKYSDRRSGKRGDFIGQAVFEPEQTALAELRYSEVIETVLDDYSGTSRQQYSYRFASDSTATVHFHDGRLFHDLDLSSGICRVHHWCEPDTYEGVFRCVTHDDWRLRWKVTGPRKHYIIESRYTRKRNRNRNPNRQ